MTDRPHASQLIASAGAAIYGEEWQNPLAKALGINERTMRRIAAAARAGEAYPVSPGALRDLEAMLDRERKALESRAFACTQTANAIHRMLVDAAKARA